MGKKRVVYDFEAAPAEVHGFSVKEEVRNSFEKNLRRGK